MKNYERPQSKDDIKLFRPTHTPPAKVYVVLPDFSTTAFYFDINLFHQEVGEVELHVKPNLDIKAGDWCLSRTGCIAQVRDVLIGSDHKGQKYHKYIFGNYTYRAWKVGTRNRPFYFTMFDMNVPRNDRTKYGVIGRRTLDFIKGGYTFLVAFKMATVNTTMKYRRTALSKLLTTPVFLRDLCIMEELMNKEASSRKVLNQLGMDREKFMQKLLDAIDAPKETEHPGVVTFAYKTIAQVLGITGMDSTIEDQPPTDQEAEKLRMVVSSEMKNMTKQG